LRHVYKYRAGINAKSAQENIALYSDAVKKGYGKSINDLAYNTPDYDKLAHLEQNVYQFSAAKNWQMLKDLTLLLKDQDKVVPFREFKAKAEIVLSDYQGKWLQTEYNAAIAGSQMASKWADIERDAQDKSMDDILLEYRTAGDQRVRDEHRKLDGIVRPASDPMWDSVYPPNGWNCRCNVIKKSRGQITPESKRDVAVNSVEIPAIFNTNLAYNGQVFPSKSPYYIGLPADVKLAHLDLQKANIKTWAKDNLIGKNYSTPVGEATVTESSLEQLLTSGDSDDFIRNMLIYKIPEIVESAEPIDVDRMFFNTHSGRYELLTYNDNGIKVIDKLRHR
jgi:SPP1 gp7 family putative phage head morphogenesis protein